MLCGLPLGAQTVRGSVHDAQGAPLASVPVTARCSSPAAQPVSVTTRTNGEFVFSNLQPCRYAFHAQRGDEIADTTADVNAANPEVRLAPLLLTAKQDTMTSPDQPVRPRFEASGIRGLIDPGGYSAPANAAATSDLLQGMAAANRAGAAACAPRRPLADLEAAHEAQPGDSGRTLDYAEGLIAAQHFEEAGQVLRDVPPRTGGNRIALLRAASEEGQGQFVAAAREYASVNATRATPEGIFAEGYEHILAGQPQHAATLFREGLRVFPSSTSLKLGLGTTEFLAAHAMQAVDLFLAAADADPADPRPYPFLSAVSGMSAANQERVQAATGRHLALVPGDAAAHLALATMLQGDATASRAEAEARRALSLDPGLVEAHVLLEKILSARGAHGEAARELQLARALAPTRTDITYRLAQELQRDGQKAAAAQTMQQFRQAKETDATDAGQLKQYLSVMRGAAQCSAANK